MVLNDNAIKRCVKEGRITVLPFVEKNIQASSLDFTLGDTFVSMKEENGVIRLNDPERVGINYSSYKDSYMLKPKSFVLATTEEYIRLPDNLVAFVEGRSSIGRLGLFIQNAGWIDAGFEGKVTLELFNASDNNILLSKGDRIGQFVFMQMTGYAENPYRGKYFKQDNTQVSLKHLDKELIF